MATIKKVSKVTAADKAARKLEKLQTKQAQEAIASKPLSPIGHKPTKQEIEAASEAFRATKQAIELHSNINGYSGLPHCEYASQTAGYFMATGMISVTDAGRVTALKPPKHMLKLAYRLLTTSARNDMANRRAWFSVEGKGATGALTPMTEKGRAALQARFTEYAEGKRDYRCSVAQARIVEAAVIKGGEARFKDDERACLMSYDAAVTEYV